MAAPLLNCLDGAEGRIVKMDATDSFLAFGSTNNSLYIADLKDFCIEQRFEFNDTVTWVQFYSPELLIACSLDGTIAYYSYEGNQFAQKLSRQCSELAKFMVHKRKIYAISEDSLLYVLDGKNLDILNVISAENVEDIAAVDEFVVFAGSELQLYNVKTEEVSDRFSREGFVFTVVSIFQDTIFTSNDGGDFFAFEIRQGKLVRSETPFEGCGEHILGVEQVTVNSYQLFLLGCSASLVCLEKNLELRYQNQIDAGITQIEQYKQNAVCGCSDGSVIVFDVLSGAKICAFEAVVQENEDEEEQIPVNDLGIFSGHLFVTGDNYVYVYSLDFEDLAARERELDNEILPETDGDAIGGIEGGE